LPLRHLVEAIRPHIHFSKIAKLYYVYYIAIYAQLQEKFIPGCFPATCQERRILAAKAHKKGRAKQLGLFVHSIAGLIAMSAFRVQPTSQQ
jgi:hypothetical protein